MKRDKSLNNTKKKLVNIEFFKINEILSKFNKCVHLLFAAYIVHIETRKTVIQLRWALFFHLSQP